MQSLPTRFLAGALSVAVLLASPSAGKRAPVAPTTSPAIQGTASTFHVEVFARDNSNQLNSLATQECALVRRVLEVPLANLASPSQAIDTVEATLRQAFAGRVRMDPDVVRYKAVWCPEIQTFKIMCCVSVVFEVALENEIVVPVEIGTRL